MESSSLSLQFDLERLKRYLKAHPEKAAELAINYFEDFSLLASDFKKLERDYQALQTQLINRQNPTSKKSPQLPSFLSIKKER